MDIKQFNKNLLAIKKSGEAMDKVMHESAMFALEQANKHGNTNFVNQLISALGRNVRKEAMITWFRSFGLLVWNDKEKVFKYSKDKKIMVESVPLSVEDALEIAESRPFYEFSVEKAEIKKLDTYVSFQAFISRMRSAAKNGKQVEHLEFIDALEQFGKEKGVITA